GRSGGNVKTEDLLILKAKHGKQDVLNLEQLILCQNVFQPHKLASTADLVSKVSALANLTPPIEENLRKLSIAELPLALENILKESRLPTDFHRLLNTA
ncbi:MAG: hypothetical protein KDD62_01120, partial [Bdellovibrionales bacterium]|nr:hypothetical protein [Bdellovibrionales bacterium]